MEKTQFFLEIIVLLHSRSQCFFPNISLKFSNINNRRVTSVHVAILLSFMQLIEEYLLARKRLANYVKNQWRHVVVMNVARGLKLHDLILSFLLLSRTNIGLKTFFVQYGRYGYSVTFWIWVVSELSRRHGNHEPKRFDFLIECKLNDGNCQFYFSHDENIKFST